MNTDNKALSTPPAHIGLLLLLWLALLLVSLFLRPLFPVDETRYASIAWDMWLHGNYLVPHLNGFPYSHKPPLLFWLVDLGWWLFGVNDIWPRLISPLFSLGCLYLTYRLARHVWPDRPGIAVDATWMLFGTLFWLIFYPLMQFDLMLLFSSLLGMLALWKAGQNQSRGWWLLTLALGLGLLSKGPVILLHLLPAALLAPLWATSYEAGWSRWYLRLLMCLLGGIVMVLTWAIPAAISGGEAYRNAIFWGQTAHRVVNSFAHKQPWWWYLPMLPVMLFPWAIWPRWWRTFSAWPLGKSNFRKYPVLRFLASWILPTFILFSLVSAKQIKYLLPILPAIAILMAWMINQYADRRKTRRFDFAAFLLTAWGVLLAALPFLPPQEKLYWIQNISPWWGAVLILLGIAAGLWKAWLPKQDILRIATASVIISFFSHFALLNAAVGSYDLRPLSQLLKQLQDKGSDIAYVGKYQEEFGFLGRLENPVRQLFRSEAKDWAEGHPQAYMVVYDKKQRISPDQALFSQDYHGRRNSLKVLTTEKYLKIHY